MQPLFKKSNFLFIFPVVVFALSIKSDILCHDDFIATNSNVLFAEPYCINLSMEGKNF